MEVHHIGYLVKDIEKSIKAFGILGYEISKEPVWDSGRVAHICFLKNGNYCVELIAPSRESSLFPLLQQYNNAPYHICYMCDSIEDTVKELRKAKFMPFLESAPAPAIGDNCRVAFLMNARAGMIELIEVKK